MAELLVVFREVFEAALIIGILYTYLNKIGAKSEIIQLWKGVTYAVLLSIIASFLFYQITPKNCAGLGFFTRDSFVLYQNTPNLCAPFAVLPFPMLSPMLLYGFPMLFLCFQQRPCLP